MCGAGCSLLSIFGQAGPLEVRCISHEQVGHSQRSESGLVSLLSVFSVPGSPFFLSSLSFLPAWQLHGPIEIQPVLSHLSPVMSHL